MKKFIIAIMVAGVIVIPISQCSAAIVAHTKTGLPISNSTDIGCRGAVGTDFKDGEYPVIINGDIQWPLYVCEPDAFDPQVEAQKNIDWANKYATMAQKLNEKKPATTETKPKIETVSTPTRTVESEESDKLIDGKYVPTESISDPMQQGTPIDGIQKQLNAIMASIVFIIFVLAVELLIALYLIIRK